MKCMFSLIKRYIKRKLKKKEISKEHSDCIFHSISTYDKNTFYEGKNVFGDRVVFTGAIGLGSYIGFNTYLPQTLIGRFCSIAWNVSLVEGSHPTRSFVSTHPSFFSPKKQAGFTFTNETIFQEIKYADRNEKYHVTIGNDVWIGANVQIISGVEIGDGAIICAGAVVAHNVPPYAIVGGVPAKVIRYRFKEEQIEFLSSFKWWEKDFDWIASNAHLFRNIDSFIETFKK